MKKFNNAELVELNLSETAGGFWPTRVEICIFTNDSLAPQSGDETSTADDQPGTPIDNETQLS